MIYDGLSFVLDLHRRLLEVVDEGPEEQIAADHDAVLYDVLVEDVGDAQVDQQSD